MSGGEVLALLSRLEAIGVRLALNDARDGLRVYGKGSPRPEVMAEVRSHKPALLAFLRGDGEEKSPALSSLPEDPAAQPGHCGSCARAKPAAPEWGAGMVVCTCDPVAWWPLTPPFAMTETAICGAYQRPGEKVGRGWRARATGKRWGELPLSPSGNVSGQGAA